MTKNKLTLTTTLTAGLLCLTIAVSIPTTSIASNNQNNDNVTICHATGSRQNPYSKLVVDDDAVDGHGNSDHNRNGHQNGEDIIPLGHWDQNGRNWDSTGQVIWNNDCNIPEATPTPTLEPSYTPTPDEPTPTDEITPTPEDEITPTPTEDPYCTCTHENPTPTEEVTPTPEEEVTPTPTEVVTPTEEPTPTPEEDNEDKSDENTEDIQTGTVQSVTALAETGVFDQTIQYSLFSLGSILVSLSGAGYVRAKKKLQ